MTDGTLASFVLAAGPADRPVRAFPTQVRWITRPRLEHMTLLQRSSPHFVTAEGTFDVDAM